MTNLRALAFVLCLPISCATLSGEDNANRLNETVEAYNHAYRWKNYETAVLLLIPDLREGYLAAYEEDESSLQIEDYKIQKLNLKSEDQAVAKIRTRYMLLPSVSVKRVTLIQHWVQIEDQWLMESEENSIRKIDPLQKPNYPTKKAIPANAEEGETELEVTPPEKK